MAIPQLSLFLENRPGRLAAICHTLTDSGVNIASLSLADTAEFGIVRLLVDRTETARDVLREAGFGVNLRDVVAVSAADEPGTLARALDTVDAAGVNVEYMYAFAVRGGAEAILVFRFDDAARVARRGRRAQNDAPRRRSPRRASSCSTGTLSSPSPRPGAEKSACIVRGVVLSSAPFPTHGARPGRRIPPWGGGAIG